jgi:enoyl-CoA hydratase
LQIVQEIEDLQIPVIGVINGYAFGGGAEIAIACDFRISSKNASFRFPGASYGLVIFSRTLPVIVGAPKAKELLFRSCIIPAEEAFRIGLIDQLLEEGELHEYANKVAIEIQSNSIAAVKKVKETINSGIGTSMEERLKLEKEANDFLVNHTNYRDTFFAFVQKRNKK